MYLDVRRHPVSPGQGEEFCLELLALVRLPLEFGFPRKRVPFLDGPDFTVLCKALSEPLAVSQEGAQQAQGATVLAQFPAQPPALAWPGTSPPGPEKPSPDCSSSTVKTPW